MLRSCEHCASDFEAKTSRARFCKTSCRVASSRAASKGDSAAEEPKRRPSSRSVSLPAGRVGLVRAVKAKVRGRAADPLAQIAIVLATRLESSEADSASGAAALSRELQRTLAALQVRPGKASSPEPKPDAKVTVKRGVSKIADFRARREGRA